jgi:hypothetical protein
MNLKLVYLLIGSLAFAALACRGNLAVPPVELKTGPTVTEDVQVEPLNSGEVAEIELVFGAGTLSIHPGDGSDLLSGTLQYNVADLKPTLDKSSDAIRLSQGSIELNGIPNFDDFTNDWDLDLGPDPMRLQINAGAYEGDYEFGGLALLDLRVIDGAAASHLQFSEPNPVEMATLRYDTGASQVTLSGLANANFEQMIFKGGAGDFTLNLSGDLQQDAHVRIDTGLSSLRIIVPEGVDAWVSMEGGMTATNLKGGWQRSGGGYLLSGESPTLTIEIEMGAGSLELIAS